MPPKNANMQKIAAICEKTAAKLGYELCDAAIEKEPTGRYLRIYIDAEEGVDIEQCEAVSRALAGREFSGRVVLVAQERLPGRWRRQRMIASVTASIPAWS